TRFGRQVGATCGVTVMGAIVNRGIPPGVEVGGEGSAIHRLAPAARAGLADAIHPAFLAAAAVSLAVFVIAVAWVKEQPLRRSLDDVSGAGLAAAARAPVDLQKHGVESRS